LLIYSSKKNNLLFLGPTATTTLYSTSPLL
jgi:hypothetical protein